MSSALEKAKEEYAEIDMRSIEIKAHVKALKKELAALKRRRKPLAAKIDRGSNESRMVVVLCA